MHATALLLTLGAAPALVFAATGPFSNYCGSNSLDYSTIISSCTNGQTSIDLSQGIGNSNGQLAWQPNGGYFGSCASNAGGSCSLQYDVLICTCRNNNGGTDQTSLALSAHLYYNTNTNTLYFNGL